PRRGARARSERSHVANLARRARSCSDSSSRRSPGSSITHHTFRPLAREAAPRSTSASTDTPASGDASTLYNATSSRGLASVRRPIGPLVRNQQLDPRFAERLLLAPRDQRLRPLAAQRAERSVDHLQDLRP